MISIPSVWDFQSRKMCECGSQQVAEGASECEICIWERGTEDLSGRWWGFSTDLSWDLPGHSWTNATLLLLEQLRLLGFSHSEACYLAFGRPYDD